MYIYIYILIYIYIYIARPQAPQRAAVPHGCSGAPPPSASPADGPGPHGGWAGAWVTWNSLGLGPGPTSSMASGRLAAYMYIIYIYIHINIYTYIYIFIYIYIYILSVTKNPHRVSQGLPNPGAKNQETLRKPSENIPGNSWETLLWEVRFPRVS